MKTIGIVCEGPTDFAILRSVIDVISGEKNEYRLIQPEQDACGHYGNGWKGVWKWCLDHSKILTQYMKDVEPVLDLLVVQLDGDVSRKEKPVHCGCNSIECDFRGTSNPLMCDVNSCPIALPCQDHAPPVTGYISHLKEFVCSLLKQVDDVCIAIPCDSLETWIVAAYDGLEDVELVEDPWDQIIAHGKNYHGIRIAGKKKRPLTFQQQFAPVVCENWGKVTQLCESARDFEACILSQFEQKDI